MARGNFPLLSFNRGLLSPKALARVDLDRTRLSAEVYNNWIPESVGAMSIRPGTKYFGSSKNDTGAEFIEFVASTDDVALLELTSEMMRIWLGEDAHELALLERPLVGTDVSISDTGWTNASTGGAFATAAIDLIPTMTAATTNGVNILASSEWAISGGAPAWQAADDNISSVWTDTGTGHGSLPSTWRVDFGAGNAKAVRAYSLRPDNVAASLDNMPSAWQFQCNDVDTGAGWTTVDSRSAQTAWAVSGKATYTRADADTGTVEAFRYWRFNFTALNGDTELVIAEIEMFDAATAQQVKRVNGHMVLNATSIGALAKAVKRVIVDPGDIGIEHSLDITVSRGPVTLRVGSTSGDDDYISETSLGTGHHNLAFTPSSNFWITAQSDAVVDRIIDSIAIGDSGTVEITSPWTTNDLNNVRYDQSADVVYVDDVGVRPQKIERRGTGRSWSIVDYSPNNGPFLSAASSSASLSVSHFFGNTTMNSDRPFFTAGHIGALVRIFHEGQSGQWRLGAKDAKTDAIQVTGISDTGTTPPTDSERAITISVTGTWSGTITLERSIDGDDLGFKPISSSLGVATDTGTFTRTIRDHDDNLKVWYRARITAYNSGVAVVAIAYKGGGITGIARVTDFSSNTSVGIEVLKRFSDTGQSSNWQEGYWSTNRGFPTAVALHEGRLCHANGGTIFLSVSDDFESFDDSTLGDAAPIIRTLGSGPVDNIVYLIALLRLIIGTVGAEIALKSSSLDEPVTTTNSSAKPFSTQGSKNIRAVKMDNRAIVVQRSGQRIFMIGAGTSGSTFGDFESFELTTLVPDLLAAGVVSVAVQRQPDTRIHAVLADGTCGILTYEPQEEVICWYTWSTDGLVERAMVLPGVAEDAVYYHINRAIGGFTRRYLEKWSKQSECLGDTGLTFLLDCAKSYTDTGHATLLTGFSHLAGEQVAVWASDTGGPKDMSPDVDGVQTLYGVDTGAGTVTTLVPVHHATVGLPYEAFWKSAKLAYAAEGGTALNQQKRVAQMGLVLSRTHINALEMGCDSGALDKLPRIIDRGAAVSEDHIFSSFDQVAFSINGTHDPDARIILKAKAPRPCTVLAIVPSVQTNDRV